MAKITSTLTTFILLFSVSACAQNQAIEPTLAPSLEQTLAFTGAKGFGQFAQGGKGGKVYIVNTLEDDPDNPTEGSLRHALKRKYARIIVFSVSGVITLKAPINVKSGHFTLAGHSSPGGITIMGAPITISDVEHAIVRYLRFRLGTYGYASDSLSVRNSKEVIIDHCSFSFSVDETASFFNNTRFTLQNSIIAHSLNDSIHPKGKHGYGGIWGGNQASFLNNVIANHNSRTPRINGHRLKPLYPQEHEFVELANNVIYNWGSNNVYGGENGRLNLINNYYKPGPDSKAEQFIALWYSPKLSENQLYIAGNYYQNKSDFSQNNYLGVKYRTSENGKSTPVVKNSPRLSSTPLAPIEVPTHIIKYESAERSYKRLITLKDSGANRNANGPFIDSLDQLVFQQISSHQINKKSQLINHESEIISSWNEYQNQFIQFPEIVDKNLDGIDDKWAKDNPSQASNINSYLSAILKN